MKLVSVLIPAKNEKYLQKTITNVLENMEGDSEIIAVCDGYWPDPSIQDHPQVTLIHNSESIGQRPAINQAARVATGKYIMKLDAHCAVDKGFDVKLAKDCEYDWTVIPRMYNLDPEKWEPKLQKRTDYMYITSPDLKPKKGERHNSKKPFRASYYDGKFSRFNRDRDPKIDETMCCMGPCFFMYKDRFWELGGCDEGHGHWGQQGIEVACKAWLSGGKLMVNKNTWFAHYFRGHIGFPYELSGRQQQNARKYSQDLWLNNKWEKQTRTFQWLVNKFNPPNWEEAMDTNKRLELFKPMYKHIHRRKNDATWKGVDILKFPTDLFMYHEAIWQKKPEVIVEIGTKFGGSALFMQDMLDQIGDGKVITIDIKDQVKEKDPRIEYIIGNSLDEKIIEQIKEKTKDKKTMLVIDGNHDRKHVKWELDKYNDIVTKGQFMVVEDCYIDRGLYGPGEAKVWFLKNYKGFKQTDFDKKYLIGISMEGWLERE
jgi:cephalosporin hydroxylase